MMRRRHLSASDLLDASLWNPLWLGCFLKKYLNALTPQVDVLLCSQETVPFLCSPLSLHSGCAKVNSLPSKSLGESSVVNEGWVAAGKGCHSLGFGA